MIKASFFILLLLWGFHASACWLGGVQHPPGKEIDGMVCGEDGYWKAK